METENSIDPKNNPQSQKEPASNQEINIEPKWDYTNKEQTLFTGALVVGLNLIVVALVILNKTVPAVHTFLTGKS